MSGRWKQGFAGLVLSGLVAVTGCAYFNLFYNAEQAFNEAETLGEGVDPRNQPTGAQTSLYQRAIAKCRLVLDEYPDSDLVDDALFLMGKSQYRLKSASSYRDAIRNFDNILASFPESDLLEDVYYFKSLSHLALGEEQVALDGLRLLEETYPESDYARDALVQLGDTYAQRDQPGEAMAYYRQYLQGRTDRDLYGRVVLSLAELQLEGGDAAGADSTLDNIDRGRVDGADAFDADLLRVRALREIDRSEEAADLLESLRSDAQRYKKRPAVLLLDGRIQLDLGREQRGVDILDALGREFQGRDIEAQARHILAEYFLQEHGPDDERVMEQLDLAIDNRVSGDFAPRIRERRQQMRRYRQYAEAFTEGDSLAYQAAFSLGELLLVDLDRPQDALDYYRRSLELAPDSALAPRAAYAMGWIQEQAGDSTAAEIAFARVRTEYPESLQAQALDGVVFLEAKPRGAPAEITGERDPQAPGPVGGSTRPALDPRRSLRRGGPGAAHPRDRAP